MKNTKPNSGDIARSRPTALRRKARRVTTILRSLYGSPRHNNKHDPLDELIFIVLSQMTTYRSFERVFNRLKSAAPRWEAVRRMNIRTLKRLIKDAGLSNQKAPRIKAILNRLTKDFGRATLRPLRRMENDEAMDYLMSLPGVQMKTAKCVLMYSLNRKVLPVDTHVLRVARRLGLLKDRAISSRAHRRLEAVVELQDRYAFHVNAIAHGRSVCLAVNPRCAECKLIHHCEHFKNPFNSEYPP